jgi:hypothetical protein
MYLKSQESQLTMHELAKIFDCVMGNMNNLTIAAGAAVPQNEYRRYPNGDGKTRTICMVCYWFFVSDDEQAIDTEEQQHKCPDSSPANELDEEFLESEPE